MPNRITTGLETAWKILSHYGLAVTIVLLPEYGLAQSTKENDWQADVARFARQLVEKNLVPGMGIAIAHGDRVKYAEGFGFADVDSRTPVKNETMFYIASSTKSFTALAIVLAASRSELDLQAPMSRYLPALKLQPPLSADSITIENLLTLTHGIADGGPVVFRTAFSGEFTTEKLLQLLSEYPPSKNGRAFVYGNLGYNILGFVLEARFGTGWKEIVERDVLRPLDMNSTTAYVSRLKQSRIAQPHTSNGEAFVRIPLGKQDGNMHAAGGHFTTAQDLARYLVAHQSMGAVEGKQIFPGKPLLSTHQLHATQDRQFGPFKRFGWGYGWDLGLYGPDTLIHRFGSFEGYRSHMSFMPSRKLGVVVLVNGDGPASSAADLMATYIYDRMRNLPNIETEYSTKVEELVKKVAEFSVERAAQIAERQKRNVPLPHPLSAYEGMYQNEELGRMVCSIAANKLQVRIGAASSEANVYDAEKNQMRVELTGNGTIIEFLFPNGYSQADTVRYMGRLFSRVEK